MTGAGTVFAGMGVAVGDVGNEGRLDLYVTHLTTERNTLWRRGGPGSSGRHDRVGPHEDPAARDRLWDGLRRLR